MRRWHGNRKEYRVVSSLDYPTLIVCCLLRNLDLSRRGGHGAWWALPVGICIPKVQFGWFRPKWEIMVPSRSKVYTYTGVLANETCRNISDW